MTFEWLWTQFAVFMLLVYGAVFWIFLPLAHAVWALRQFLMEGKSINVDPIRISVIHIRKCCHSYWTTGTSQWSPVYYLACLLSIHVPANYVFFFFQNCRCCLFICLIRVPEVMLRRYSSVAVCVNPWQLFDLVAKGKNGPSSGLYGMAVAVAGLYLHRHWNGMKRSYSSC